MEVEVGDLLDFLIYGVPINNSNYMNHSNMNHNNYHSSHNKGVVVVVWGE
jgi:hypothetical protein